MTSTKRERIDALYADLRAGVSSAFAGLIQEMMGPAEMCVDDFCNTRPQFARLRDDLIGEAYLELTARVTKLQQPHDALDNPRDYIRKAIENALAVFCNRAYIVGPARQDKVPPGSIPVVIGCEALATLRDRRSADRQTRLELLQEIRECCQSDLEHEVITLRLRGLTDSAIAAELEVSQQTVSLVRSRVRKRYDDACKCESEPLRHAQ